MTSPHLSRRDLAPLAVVSAAATAGVLPAVVAGPADAASQSLVRTGIRLHRVRGSVVRSASVPLDSGTTRLPSSSFGLVGFTWRGRRPELRFRTRAGGVWSAWQHLHPLADRPDADSLDGRRMRGSAAEGTWVGVSDGVEVDTDRRVTMVLVDPGVVATDVAARRLPARPLARREKTRREKDGLARPAMYGRRLWGADETWATDEPRYCERLQQVHIHHTASSNDYAPGDVPGLLRSFYYYHTHALGWSDIGYNFLVDRWGRIWVGRAGGVNELVRGAHTLGFNATSCGIAVIGNYDVAAPPIEVIKALAQTAAWKLHKAGHRARGRVSVTSEGSDYFRAGEVVRLPRIDGHRDTNQTACPGVQLYAQLPSIRRRAQHRINHFTKPVPGKKGQDGRKNGKGGRKIRSAG